MKNSNLDMVNVDSELIWRVHTPNLLKEVAQNPNVAPIAMALQILGLVLYEVGECASRLNDPEMNALMCRLTIYDIADPHSESYDLEELKKILIKGHKAHIERTS